MPPVAPYPVTNPRASHALIELFGGHNSLADYVSVDLREMSKGMQAAHPPISVLCLTDRPEQGGEVVEITATGRRQVLEKLGPIDTGDPETLAAFLARALVTYPDARKAIGFWDHGSGTADEQDPDEMNIDPDAKKLHRGKRQGPARQLFVGRYLRRGTKSERGTYRAMLEDAAGGILTNYEAHGVMAAAFDRAGVQGKVDVIFSDTCLNGMIEVLDQFAPFASVIVASEESEPGDGWDYKGFFERLAAALPERPEDWAAAAVDSFGAFYADRPDEFPCTLAGFRSDQEITARFADLVTAARALGPDGFSRLDLARSYSQSVCGYNNYDVRDFADQVAARVPPLAAPARALAEACDAACVKSVALGAGLTGTHGLAFWFPSGQFAYLNEAGTYQKLEFARRTGWAAYLQERYCG